jgi:hypothetical protein
MVVFLVSGLWHGASWTFVAWGALHGIYLVAGLITGPFRERVRRQLQVHHYETLHRVFQTLLVFSLVCFAWIFFRANSIGDSLLIVSGLASGWAAILETGWMSETRLLTGLSAGYFNLAMILILVLEVVQARPEVKIGGWSQLFWSKSTSLRWAGYVALVLAIINLGAPKSQPFIYFQF